MASTTHLNKSSELEFIVPPEAKVFYPTEEEFKNPLTYIHSIQPLAETTGICKIVPPKNWKAPFSLDVDNFKFTARLQKLSLLDGKTRLKSNFLDLIDQFWELQGIPLVIPRIEDRQLDLYDLYRLTREHHANVGKIKWESIAQLMNFDSEENTFDIKQCFENILQPFIVYNELSKSEPKSCDIKPSKIEPKTCDIKPDIVYEIESDDDDVIFIAEEIKQDSPKQETVIKPSVRRELKRLRFLGPGPKMDSSTTTKKRRSTKPNNTCYADEGNQCSACGKSDDEASMFMCRGCKDEYHFACIKPALPSLPRGKWHCLKCVSLEITKPVEDFGFEQAKEECSLFEFSEMADRFKSEYFNSLPHLVSSATVEKAYWKLVSSADSDVIVRYGADLHTVDNGSGFPTDACTNLEPGDLEYVHSGWNLNNLPVLKNSLLRYINSDVSGMKLPWMYVGMCFATFCWHNEDHWLCSINYLHWGDCKTWYGVPGSSAETLENAMKNELPELFEAQPDILHQLVTVMNPNTLMDAGVPIYKLEQNEGEFVITFPRAYHMGFNTGFNFAEAVNFAPIDWFKIGRESVLNYAQVKRFCCFSHDELLCTMACSYDKLSPVLANIIHSDMEYVIKKEEKLRKHVLESGITNMQRVELELLPDDKRHCDVCKTTCYLSAVTCGCSDELLVCLDHYNDLCECVKSKQMLRYRYTLDEMQVLLGNIASVLDRYNIWLEKVENTLNRNCVATVTDLEDLLKEAESKDYPDYYRLRQALSQIVVDVDTFIQ